MVNPLRLPTRSGVTDAEVALRLPGDDLVPDATETIDRAATFAVAPRTLWPWLVQLGKGRAGWYLPRRVETLIPSTRRGIRHLDDRWQRVRPGDDEADYGPGEPIFRASVVDPPHALVWHSLRDLDNRHRWPTADSTRVLALSWALVLRETPEGTRLHIRLRIRAKHAWLAKLGGLFDWLTIVGLVAGLRERV